MSATVTYRFVCDLCGRTREEVPAIGMHPMNIVNTYGVPAGWDFVAGRYICEQHAISVLRDGPSLVIRKERVP